MTDSKLLVYLIAVPSLIITVAGVKAAAPILVPLLLSFVLATIAGSFLLFLRGRGLPRWLSMAVVLLAVVLLVIGLGIFLSSAAIEFSGRIPAYQEKFLEILNQLLVFLSDFGITVEQSELLHPWSPMMIMGYLSAFLQSLQQVVAQSFMILVVVIFLLSTQDVFFRKMHALLDEQRYHQLIGVFSQRINHYFLIKSSMSVLTGLSVAAGLYLLGIEYAFLWGVIAFMFNFVPTIGSIIAAVPPMLLALADHGWAMSLWVGLLFLVINIVFGIMVETRMMGRGLGLSSSVVLLSLIFWGWVLGPVGMLISVPLTMMVKVACDLSPRSRWLSILLGDGREPL